MAEKRVSVRLAVIGGEKVRTALEGVGEAGKRGFGRLSQEMEAANRRLAGFSRRVKVAAAAAVAAATAAGVAMIRSTSTHSVGCSSCWRWAGSPLPSGRGSTTGRRACADEGQPYGRAARPAFGTAGGWLGPRNAHRRPVPSQPPSIRRTRGLRRRAARNTGAHLCHPPPDAGRRRAPPSQPRRSS